jgi:hypothetical protein
MHAEGIRKALPKTPKLHQPRHRRACVGEWVDEKRVVSEAFHDAIRGDFKLYYNDTLLEYEIIKKYDFQERTMGMREIHDFLNQKKTNKLLLPTKNDVTLRAVSS